ncbi:hypothetical protein NHX12_009646 [Muraenolepis orangiensis]|uniref:Cyclin-like domain-containing protein n=1 Tax=Muraenolepis orangiensis TaxID=630683 RepID=A0A9Q0I6J7_9TELE|nr:hypothetical protein NHX12_009646 [Muraenolepis orangiensis]
MKNPGAGPEARRLALLLDDALLMEARHWKVPLQKGECIQGTDISLSEHRNVVLWLGDMGRLFHFLPETVALGVCVLNRLLSTVKAQPKYLRCIAFTSLILAAKINEEDEVIGSIKDLVGRSGCNFSTAEILRMERTILDKLHWDLYTATPVDFIHIFHALLVSGHPGLIPSIGRGRGRGRGGVLVGSGSGGGRSEEPPRLPGGVVDQAGAALYGVPPAVAVQGLHVGFGHHHLGAGGAHDRLVLLVHRPVEESAGWEHRVHPVQGDGGRIPEQPRALPACQHALHL